MSLGRKFGVGSVAFAGRRRCDGFTLVELIVGILITVAVVVGGSVDARATYVDTYSIYDLRYTTDASGDSPYNRQVVNCTGGIVMQKYVGGKVRKVDA